MLAVLHCSQQQVDTLAVEPRRLRGGQRCMSCVRWPLCASSAQAYAEAIERRDDIDREQFRLLRKHQDLARSSYFTTRPRHNSENAHVAKD